MFNVSKCSDGVFIGKELIVQGLNGNLHKGICSCRTDSESWRSAGNKTNVFEAVFRHLLFESVLGSN